MEAEGRTTVSEESSQEKPFAEEYSQFCSSAAKYHSGEGQTEQV